MNQESNKDDANDAENESFEGERHGHRGRREDDAGNPENGGFEGEIHRNQEGRERGAAGASDPESEGFEGEIRGHQGSSDNGASNPKCRNQDKPLDIPPSEQVRCDKAPNNQCSPKPQSPPFLPGPPAEPPAFPTNTSTQGAGTSTADSAALTEGDATHLFTLDGPVTRIGRKRKARDLHAILEGCVCGETVTDWEISNGEGVIRCKSVGCETEWVSTEILRERETYR